jgi:hypothetical protein
MFEEEIQPGLVVYDCYSIFECIYIVILHSDIGAGGMFVIAVHGYGPGDSYFTLKVDSGMSDQV